MIDFLELGPVPADEESLQVGTPQYIKYWPAEADRYRLLLTERFKDILEHVDVHIHVRNFPHDFGTYHELIVLYDDSVEGEVEAAIFIENNLPLTWDDKKKFTMEDLKGSNSNNDAITFDFEDLL